MKAPLTPNGRKVFSLYKYASLGSQDRRDHVRDIFQNNAVWLASPASFNDPFDCKFEVSFHASTEEKRRMYYQYLTDRQGLHLSPEVACKKAEELFSPGRPVAQEKLEAWEQDRRANLQTLPARLGVLCLSELNDHILMWAHYADCHRGICLEFRFDLNEPEHRNVFAKNFRDVKYRHKFPLLNFYTTPWGGPKRTVMAHTKSKHWEYEREWRWTDAGGPGERPLPPRLLWAVILGAKTPTADKEEVFRWNAARDHPLCVCQARLKEAEYGLDIEPVDNSSRCGTPAQDACGSLPKIRREGESSR